jgi:hypothetical protein
VKITLSTEDCYDLADRPIETHLTLLSGGLRVTAKRVDGGYEITVPWEDDLPQGRTSIGLFATAGGVTGNPAVVNVYRKRGELPGPGLGPGDYGFKATETNRRPVVLNLVDHAVAPGETVSFEVRAVDPEGFPVRIYRRAGEPGELDGNLFTFHCPSGAKPGPIPVTLIASDSTSGNSYAGKTIRFEVAPKVFAAMKADRQVGPAPLTVNVSAEGSRGAKEYGWDFYAPSVKRKRKKFEELPQGPTAKHTFEKPGVYEIELTAKSGSATDTETLSVLVTESAPTARPAGIAILGNGAGVGEGVPTPFNHTWFGSVAAGRSAEREFLLVNTGDEDLVLDGGTPVVVSGPRKVEFRVTKSPRSRIGPRGSATFRIRFEPRGAGERLANVRVRGGDETLTFAVGGWGDVDQDAVDRAAMPAFETARKLFEEGKYAAAKKALSTFLKEHPGATSAAEAAALLEKIEKDPEIRGAMEKAAAAREEAEALEARQRKAKSLWTLAENYRKNGRSDLATKSLERLARDYPDTTWGKKAKAALAK